MIARSLKFEAPCTCGSWMLRPQRTFSLSSLAPSPLVSAQASFRVDLVRNSPPSSNELVLETIEETEDAIVFGALAKRRSQGYSVPMLVEESRMLQVSIFHTLQNNLNVVDFSLLLIDVMTIADEVDSQLKVQELPRNGRTGTSCR